MKYTTKEQEEIQSQYLDVKVLCDPSWTKYILTTHPIEYISTIGRVNGRIITNVAPFATCLDTSYNPPYVQFSAALKQHAVQGQTPPNTRMNTYSNILQNKLFVVNVPHQGLLEQLDIIAYPYKRKELEDKIVKARLTKMKPFILPQKYNLYPPLIGECLAHLECIVLDIHRPKGSDHYNITGEVVGASYNQSLGKNPDEIRLNLIKQTFHHFGASSQNPSKRYIGYINPTTRSALTFKLEEKPSDDTTLSLGKKADREQVRFELSKIVARSNGEK
jgi:flavin reductase (DIM6/NTAB) family NADH-FMN oxidoreductase RutF